MIEGIFIGIATAGIIACINLLYKKGYIHIAMETILFYASRSGIQEERIFPKGTNDLQKKIIRLLLLDQSRFGRHRGEFGRLFDPSNADKWQAKHVSEKVDLKPRMYLTYWPSLVFHKYSLAKRSVKLTYTGIKSLFVDSRIPIASNAPRPIPIRLKQRKVNNLRHTMEGAHLLWLLNPLNRITKSVIDLMLDNRNEWQDCKSGGWWHTDEPNKEVDVWSSVYAVKLLGSIETISPNITSSSLLLAQASLSKTIEYLENLWEANNWGIPNQVSVEENLVLMYIDLVEYLPLFSKSHQSEFLQKIESWLSPFGVLKDSYLNILFRQESTVFPQQAYVRVAYALFLSNSDKWMMLFEKAIEYGKLKEMLASDLAFLLDLSHSYQNPTKKEQAK